jgi:outer membrane usher protein
VRADNAAIPDTPEQLGLRGGLDGALQLQVFLNGSDTKQIVAFERDAAGRFRAKRSELAAIGLKTGFGDADAMLTLVSFAGLSYRYDENAQTLALVAPENLLAPKIYSAAPPRSGGGGATSDWGVALNYDFYASTASWWPGERFGFGSGSVTLDARAFSPLGVISQSAILGATAFDNETALRLDTTFRYDDDAHGVTYQAGDFINAGLPWTRPVRLGGVQIQHDFGLRPDLVLGPSATVSGTAAVPSSADVFVNNFKIFSEPVDAGPFRIENLPAIDGAGSATLVLHDVTGKQTTQAVPFFVSSRLLAPGALDYSAEAGYARQYYGLASFDYDPHLVGSASLRAGITDWATVESHVEGGDGLYNGGLGGAFSVFQRAVIDASLAGSAYGGKWGGQVAFGVSTGFWGATLDVSTQHALAAYADLAEVTAPPGESSSILTNYLQTGPSSGLLSPLLLSTSVAPPRALDRISLTFPRALELASLNLSLVNEVDGDGSTSRIASLGVTRNFNGGLSAFATAFADFVGCPQKPDYGVMAGLSYTFSDGISASTQSSLQGRGFSQTTELNKSAGQEVGDYGGSLSDQEGVDRYLHATAAYQSAVGRATVQATQYGAGGNAAAAASAEFVGSVAALGGGFGFAPQIPDSFAMVDAGAPGVAVLEDNRVVGKTDSSGRLLVTGLRGFQDNKIGIDPTTLPLDAQTSATEMSARPRAQSGVVADFKVKTNARDAEIVLTDEAGAPLPPGAKVDRPDGGAAAVGYDGRAYIEGLAPHNVVKVRANGQTCLAAFDFASAPGAARPTIGPVVCKLER